MNRPLTAAAILLLAGCTAAPPAPTVTVTATVPATSSAPADSVERYALELTWDALDATTQESICLAFEVDKDWAWSQFDDGTGAISRAVFTEFLTEVCP